MYMGECLYVSDIQYECVKFFLWWVEKDMLTREFILNFTFISKIYECVDC